MSERLCRSGCQCLDCQRLRSYPRLMDGMAEAFTNASRAEKRRERHARLDGIARALACAGLLAEADRVMLAAGSFLDRHAAELRREAARIAFESSGAPNGQVLR